MTETVGRATARRTALSVAIVVGGIAAWQTYRGHSTAAAALGSAAALLAFVGTFVPPAARWFHRVWMAIAEALGYVNTRVILSLVYYGLVAPTGIVMRLTSHDPLDRRHGTRDSYWTPREHTRQSREKFERAF